MVRSRSGLEYPGSWNELHRRVRRVARRTYRTASRFPAAHLALAGVRTGAFVARGLAGSQRPSPGLIAQTAMDEAVLAVMKNPSRIPDDEDLAWVADEMAAARLLFQERGWADDPAAYHPRPPALDRPGVGGGRWLGLKFERLVYESGYEPHPGEPGRERWLSYEANHAAYAWVLRHRDGPRPWLVCLHGFGTGRPFMDFYAFRAVHLHHTLGLNVVLPVLPLHGARSAGGFSGSAFMSYDQMNVVHGMAQAVWETRRLLGWIRAQEPTAVGLYGISLGSYVTALMTGLEDGIDCAIAGIPVCDLPSLYVHHAPERLMRRPLAMRILSEAAADVLKVVSPLTYRPLVPREGRFVYAGIHDRMATPEQATRLWEHWERPEMAWFKGNHVGFLWSHAADGLVARALDRLGPQEHPGRVPGAETLDLGGRGVGEL